MGHRHVIRSVVLLFGLVASPALAQRDRIRLDDDWRFTQGDPAGITTDLRYDVRPEIVTSADGKVADAPPEAAVAVQANGAGTLKRWILPSANAVIGDPARRHVRPAGDPGGDVAYVQPGFDDSAWQRVTLPHDWAIAGPFLKTGPYGGMGRLRSWGIGWYRRTLDVPASDRGRRVFLDVDGAMSYATVWLNGRLVGGWPYGYNGWRLDLTPFLRFGGSNQLAIRLDNPAESARWYPGGGLYRDVWLVKTAPVHVAQWGSAIATPAVTPDAATVSQRLAVANDGAFFVNDTAATEIYTLTFVGSGRCV